MVWTLFAAASALAAQPGDRVPAEIAAALEGRAGLVNVWASWCGPCRAELPVLAALHGRLGGRAIVLAVNIDAQRRPAVALIHRLGVDLPVIYDPDGGLAKALAPPEMPTTYLVDPSGVVREVRAGGIDERAARDLEQALATLAGAP